MVIRHLVALHAVNTVLLFDALRRRGVRPLVAGTLAALWGVCPIQAGALGWMAVVGHVLLGTIVLVWLRDLASVLARDVPLSRPRLIAWVLMGMSSATSFAIGLAIALLLPLVAPILLWGVPGRRPAMRALGVLLLLVPTVYLAQQALYPRLFTVAPFSTPVTTLRLTPSALGAQLVEALHYVRDFAVYAAGILVAGGVGAVPQAAADVMLARLRVPALVVLGVTVWGLARAPRARALQGLGLLLLGSAGYVAIAVTAVLSGRTAEAMGFGLDRDTAIASIALIPRYHYVPTLFVTGALGLAVSTWDSVPVMRRWTTAAMLLLVTWIAVRDRWDAPMVVRHVTPGVLASEIRRLDAEIAAAPEAAGAVVVNGPVGSGLVVPHEEAFPGRAALYVVAHPDGVVRGKAVRFVERDPRLLETIRAQTGTPIARLVFGPTHRDGWDAGECP
jgi:hypothetical protein